MTENAWLLKNEAKPCKCILLRACQGLICNIVKSAYFLFQNHVPRECLQFIRKHELWIGSVQIVVPVARCMGAGNMRGEVPFLNLKPSYYEILFHPCAFQINKDLLYFPHLNYVFHAWV